MNVLVACEESQVVCKAFRARGHNAFSCDIIECSGGHPEWHIRWDVKALLNGRCLFFTQDGQMHEIADRWDMIIFFPPCTFLTNTGNRWFAVDRYGEKAIEREKNRQKAAEFFMMGWNADCDKVVIENPIGYMSTYFRKPDQIVHPYYFAKEEDDENCERKATCLWERGVQPLMQSDGKNGLNRKVWCEMARHIDADALSKLVYRRSNNMRDTWSSSAVLLAIDSRPTIEARPVVRGRWVDLGRNYYTVVSQCSECGAKYDFRSPYCPNCGAETRERREGE